MLTNPRLHDEMDLMDVSQLDDLEFEERIDFCEQLIYELEWSQIKEIAAGMDTECNRIKDKTKLEIQKLEAWYSKQEKEMLRDGQVERTRILSIARLKLLEEKEKHVADVVLQVYHRLGRVDHLNHKRVYKRILYALIVQAVCRLLEPEAFVVFRVADVPIGTSVFSQAEAKYKQLTGLDVTIRLDTSQYLPMESCGGVDVRSARGERTVTNTLAIRLDNVLFKVNPMIRIALYGSNRNRLFFDMSEMSGSANLFGWSRDKYSKRFDTYDEEQDEWESFGRFRH